MSDEQQSSVAPITRDMIPEQYVGSFDAMAREIERLRGELAQCKADAERYRWLKTNSSELDYWAVMQTGRHDLDVAIDAARGE